MYGCEDYGRFGGLRDIKHLHDIKHERDIKYFWMVLVSIFALMFGYFSHGVKPQTALWGNVYR